MAKKKNDAKSVALKILDKYIKQKKIEGVRIGWGSDKEFGYGKSPTPFPTVNAMIGGGLPRGKLTVFSGPPGSCKSTAAAQSLAKAQLDDLEMLALWVDIEHCWDTEWMTKLGVDTDRVIVVEMLEDLEQTLDIIIEICAARAVGFIVYDSVGAIAPRGEFESKKGVRRDMKEDTVGLTARQFNKFLRIATPQIARADCVIILIAQVYSTIGTYSIEQVKGGNGIAHHAHLRLIFRRVRDESKKRQIKMPGADKKSTVLLGWNVAVKVDKTKQSGTEGYSAVLPFRLGAGMIAAEAAVISAIQFGVIPQSGAWFDVGLEKNLQGKDAVIDYYMQNEEAFAELTERLEDIAEEEMVARIKGDEFEPEVDEDEEDDDFAVDDSDEEIL